MDSERGPAGNPDRVDDENVLRGVVNQVANDEWTNKAEVLGQFLALVDAVRLAERLGIGPKPSSKERNGRRHFRQATRRLSPIRSLAKAIFYSAGIGNRVVDIAIAHYCPLTRRSSSSINGSMGTPPDFRNSSTWRATSSSGSSSNSARASAFNSGGIGLSGFGPGIAINSAMALTRACSGVSGSLILGLRRSNFHHSTFPRPVPESVTCPPSAACASPPGLRAPFR